MSLLRLWFGLFTDFYAFFTILQMVHHKFVEDPDAARRYFTTRDSVTEFVLSLFREMTGAFAFILDAFT